ncbi:GntR family transcriptional regulator [Streptomyces lydicus]|uniref:GntR family transcriptional regulator n=1 Tax=Streptomyces lydicus TaxID=47763 RepID=UPI00369CF669
MPPEKAQAKYRQIAEYLRQGILDGTYPAGQPLPSEELFAKRFGVSRLTVRQGISELRASDLVEVMMSRGMFVRSPHSRPSVTRPRGVRRDAGGRYVEADGLRWTDTEEPAVTRIGAPLALADLLRTPPGDRCTPATRCGPPTEAGSANSTAPTCRSPHWSTPNTSNTRSRRLRTCTSHSPTSATNCTSRSTWAVRPPRGRGRGRCAPASRP